MTLAASELGITPSAVSHQIRHLTEIVGEQLLVRRRSRLDLTPTGERLSQRLQAAFFDIDRSINEAIGENPAILRLAAPSNFASAWLVPRLAHFFLTHPNHDVQLIPRHRPELSDTIADVFVTSQPNEAGFASMMILRERLVPVCHAATASRFGVDLPFITVQPELHMIGQDWHEYVTAVTDELSMPPACRWLLTDDYAVALDMTRAGLGAALIPDFMAETELSSGRFIQLHSGDLETSQGYYLCFKESRRKEPKIEALIRWIKQEIAHDRAAAPAARTNGAAHVQSTGL